MDITKFFNSKKRDLSNNSNAEEDAKRQREESPSESPNVSMLDTPKTPVFEESLKSEDCVKILLSCLRNLEKEVKDIHKLALSNNDNQIKGEKQLADLSESIKFMSDKFYVFGKERQEQEKVFEELGGGVSSLNEKLNGFTEQGNRQNSRQNCLLIYGITEGNQKNTDDLALEIFREKLDIELTQRDLDRTHRTGKNDKRSNRPRPVIVKFIRYNDRKKIFSKKKQLKNSGISITESLTKLRMSKLAKAREEFGFRNVWTVDGRICYIGEGSQSPKTYYN